MLMVTAFTRVIVIVFTWQQTWHFGISNGVLNRALRVVLNRALRGGLAEALNKVEGGMKFVMSLLSQVKSDMIRA